MGTMNRANEFKEVFYNSWGIDIPKVLYQGEEYTPKVSNHASYIKVLYQGTHCFAVYISREEMEEHGKVLQRQAEQSQQLRFYFSNHSQAHS